jgi:hypothetical protein
MRRVWTRWGFRWEKTNQSEMNFIHDYGIPLYLPMLVSAILPLVWLRKRLRARRAALTGHCINCCYALRASPERCPECGGAANQIKIQPPSTPRSAKHAKEEFR